jgi:hypothetical protein
MMGPLFGFAVATSWQKKLRPLSLAWLLSCTAKLSAVFLSRGEVSPDFNRTG